MKNKPLKSREEKASKRRHQHEAEACVGGALAGAAMGVIGGPPGALAGAVIGGIVGAVAAGVADLNSDETEANDRKLDVDIGVIGGDIGAPNLKILP